MLRWGLLQQNVAVVCAEHLATGEGLLAVSGKWVAYFLLNEDHHLLDLGSREALGKKDLLVYLVDPGEQGVHPVENDGGDLLDLLENAVVLDQIAALGDQIQRMAIKLGTACQTQGQEATSTPMPSSTSSRPSR